MSPVRFLVAPLEPKVKINKTLQINDLRRFSFVKNRHFWCKMRKFSVLFMDIFWIPQKCTLIASYFAIFQYLTAISTIHYPAILSGILSIRVHTNNVSINSTLIVSYFAIFQYLTAISTIHYPALFVGYFRLFLYTPTICP